MRVAVIDDDLWKRAAMAEQLNGHRQVSVVDAVDQDEAAAWETSRWDDVDAVVVDVYDDRAPGEIGTDLYSGINVLERVKSLPVEVLAVIPQSPHPLVQLRLGQAQPDHVYHRWEVPTVDALVDALVSPDLDHRPVTPAVAELRKYGARNVRANAAVRVYVESSLYGQLVPGVGHKGLCIPRRALDRFKCAIAEQGFVSTEALSTADSAVRVPRWPDVRDFVLRLLGRLDAPASEFDKPWWLP